MCLSRLFSHLSQAPYEIYSLSLNNNELVFKGNTNAHLQAACDAILDPTKKITSAVFNVPVEVGWYGVRFRVNLLNLNAIQTLLNKSGNPTCKLTSLTINDRCLTMHELNNLCAALADNTTITQINANELVLESNYDQVTFDKLKNNLQARGISLSAKPSYEPTFGTTYH